MRHPLICLSIVLSVTQGTAQEIKPTRTLEGHSHLISCMAFSPTEDTLLASGAYDNTVKLWDVEAGQEKATLRGHSDVVGGLAFSPDGKLLASACRDRVLRLWDVASAKERATFPSGPVTFSPDSKLLAVGGLTPKVRFWSTTTHKEEGTIDLPGEAVNSLAFSPNGKLLALGRKDRSILIWDMATGKEKGILTGHTSGAYAWGIKTAMFSQDGQTLLTTTGGRAVMLWDVQTMKEKATFKGYTDHIRSAALTPDSRLVAGGLWIESAKNKLEGKTVVLWDVNTGKEKAVLTGDKNGVESLAISRDGKYLASGSRSKTITTWKLPSD